MPNWRRNREGRKILTYRVTLQSKNSKISLSTKDIACTRVLAFSLSRNATLLGEGQNWTIGEIASVGVPSCRIRKPAVLNMRCLPTRRVIVMTTI